MNGVGNGGVTTGMAANSSMSGGAGGAAGGFATLGREDRKSKKAELKLELERVNKELQRVEVKIAKKRRSLGHGGGQRSRKSEDGKRGVKRKSTESGGKSAMTSSEPMSREARRQVMLKERNRRVQSLWGQCATILKQLKQNRNAWPFHKPVDWRTLGIPDYPKIVKMPMDMQTVADKLGGFDAKCKETPREYKSLLEFRDDLRLIFDNCQLYNPVGSDVRQMGDSLADLFEKKWQNSNLEGKFAMELEHQKREEDDLKNFQSYRGVSKHQKTASQQLDHLQTEINKLKQQMPGGKKAKPGDDPNADMSFEEKRKLSVNLGMLPAEKLGRVVQIINEGPSKIDNSEEEIELDIDKLDNQTLWRLNKYVNSCLKGAKKNTHQEKIQRMQQQQEETARKLEDVNATLASRSAGGPSTDFSPVSSKRQLGADKDSDSSDSESESAEGVGSDGDMKKNSSFAGDVTRVSTTRPQGSQPQILNDSGNREVTLKNASAWETLTEKDPGGAKSPAEASAGEKKAEAGNSLWSEFQSREQQMKAREKAELERKQQAEKEEKERKEREEKMRIEKAEKETEELKAAQAALLTGDTRMQLPEKTEELKQLQKSESILPSMGLTLVQYDEDEAMEGEDDAEEGEL